MRQSLMLVVACTASACIIITPGGAGGGGGSAKVYCVKDKASGACYCDLTDPGLTADTDYVSNCDALPADTQCCYDINGDGETTSCNCYRALCATDTDTDKCECGYFGTLLIGNNRDNEKVVATCPNTACCRGSETCTCNGPNCSGNETAASSCSTSDIPSKRTCSGGDKWAANCSGVKWKK